MRREHPVLIKHGETTLAFEDPLDHEHDVGTPGIKFIEHQSDRPLDRPRQYTFDELGDLLTVAHHDCIAADKVHPTDVTIEVNPHHRPVQPGSYLLDMCRLASAVIPLHQHTAIVCETGQDGLGDLRVKPIRPVELRHIISKLTRVKNLNLQVALKPKQISSGSELSHVQNLSRKSRVKNIGRSEGRAGGAEGRGDQEHWSPCPTNVGPSGAKKHRTSGQR